MLSRWAAALIFMQPTLIIASLCSSSGLTDINNTGGADLTGIIYHLGTETRQRHKRNRTKTHNNLLEL